MTLTFFAMLIAVAWLAYSNGANDNFKGVATLFASHTVDYGDAIRWAMVTTFAGSVATILLGGALIKSFSGKGLVGIDALADKNFLLAVTLAASATVFLATRIGFPISTTHAIIGGLVGAGLIAPGGVELLLLGSRFLLPLLMAPMLAIAITLLLYAVMTRLRRTIGVKRETCVCLAASDHVVAVDAPPLKPFVSSSGELMLQPETRAPDIATGLRVVIDDVEHCKNRYRGEIVGTRIELILAALHFLTAGTVGFARGLQDTAKITGLLVGAGIVSQANFGSLVMGVALVGGFMALGGLVGARAVSETLGQKIASMNSGQGFVSNLVTSLLVTGSAFFGWGVSTTHCSVGALFGIGVANATGQWSMIRQIIFAWIITLPVGAATAYSIYWLLSLFISSV